MAAPPLAPPRSVDRPTPASAARSDDSAGGATGPDRSQDILLLIVVAVLVAACLPLTRVFIGLDFARPVAAALLLSVGLSWVTRRAGGGPTTSLVVSGLGFCLLVSIAFLPSTLAFGVLPTLETAGAARDLWLRGLELVRVRPAPAFAEDGLLLLTVAGVWWVAHVVEGFVFRLAAPLRALGMALVLWTVPLAVAPDAGRVWVWAVPLLAAGAALLLTASSTDLSRWGSWVAAPRRPGGRRHNPLVVAGWPVAITAIVAGAALGGLLPGFGDPPWYEVKGTGGTTLTTNPIVSIRSNLVELSENPVARVTSPQPVYLRLTALDVYGEAEEWRSDGIRGGSVNGRLPFETPMSFFREIDVDVAVQGLPGAVIVPVPYHPTGISGNGSSGFQYDRDRATITLASGAGLGEGDDYSVTAAVPAPPADLLRASTGSARPSLTALPGNVPVEVAELAERITAEAGATTDFDRALAIQDELRTWEYSLDPPQGHGASAMRSFIENRIGYCEQYAGTMAVMLRTLGIPARVAVGYTPGDLIDAEAGIYQVRNANAHAWVEVLFDELGWIAFEPTPRSDGNVLVPGAENLAPTQMEAQIAEEAPETPQAEPQAPDIPERQQEVPEPVIPEDAGASGLGGESGGEEDRTAPLLVTLLVLLGLGGGAALLASRRRAAPDGVPSAVVLDGVARVQRVARGLGSGPSAAETDAEFLNRIAPGSRHAATLATAAGRARWSPSVPAETADEARRAADGLCDLLVADRGTAGRALLRVRGSASRVAEEAGRRLRSARDEAVDTRSVERLARLVSRRRR